MAPRRTQTTNREIHTMSPTATIAANTSGPIATIDAMAAKRIGATCEIGAADLKRALTRIKPATSKRSALQTLSGVRIYRGAGGVAYIAATNLETAARLNLTDANMSAGFDTLLGVRELAAALKGAGKDSRVTFTIDEGGRVSVAVGPASYSLRELRREDWPSIDFAPDGLAPIVEASGAELERAIARAAVFASADQTRPVLTGIYITGADGGRIVATDSYRLDVAPFAGIDPETALNIPAGALVLALKGAGKGKNPPAVTILHAPLHRCVIVTRPGETWRSRIIDGQFPNYRQLIPDEGDKTSTAIGVPLADMLAAASAGAAVIERNAPIRLTFHKDGDARERCEFSGYTPDGTEYAAHVDGLMVGQWRYGDGAELAAKADTPTATPFAGVDSSTLEIGLNPTFLAETLGAQTGEVIGMSVISAIRPVVFRDTAGGVSLLMPIRLNV